MPFQIIVRYFFFFLLYSFFGWIIESAYHSLINKRFTNRGILSGPFCLQYGFNAVILIILKNYIRSLGILFLIAFVLTSATEYFVSLLLGKVYGLQFWNYDHSFCNLRGRISLGSSVVWGVLSLVCLDVLHPAIVSVMGKIPDDVFLIVSGISLLWLVVDFVSNNRIFSSLNRRLSTITRLDNRIQYRHERIHEMLDSALGTLLRRRNQLMENCPSVHRRYLRTYPLIRSSIYPSALDSLKQSLMQQKE